MDPSLIINTLSVVFLYFVISIFSLDMKIPYPKQVVIMFHEPLSKIVAYLVVFCLASYNPILSILTLILVIFLHDNDINMVN